MRENIINNKHPARLGVSLIEVVIALLVFGLAVLPMFEVLFSSQQVAVKQADQEQCIKVAEATINQLMSVQFQFLNNPPTGTEIGLMYQDQDGSPISVKMPLQKTSDEVWGTVDLKIHKTNFSVTASMTRIFSGFTPGPGVVPPPDSLVFKYGQKEAGSYILAEKAYNCPDDYLKILVRTTYGDKNASITLAGSRANLVD